MMALILYIPRTPCNPFSSLQEKYAAALRTISFMQTPSRDSSNETFTRSPEPRTRPVARGFKTPSKKRETAAPSTTNQYRSSPTAGPTSASNDLMNDFMASVAKVLARYHCTQCSS